MKKFALPFILLLIGLILTAFSLFSSTSEEGELNVEIIKTKTIMPAAHNVYSNKNALDGQYYLFKAKLTNNAGHSLEDVVVSYEIPGIVEWTELNTIGQMFPGQTASVVCYPNFGELIAEKTTESVEKVNIKITWDNASQDDEIEESFDFKIANRNEYFFTHLPSEEITGWRDIYANDVLLPCFVTPNDPIVKYYTQNIQEKILKGEQASVSKNEEDAVRFLMGIYQATLQSGMVYSSTKGIPETLQDQSQLSQHNRLPREVITGNTGLCLELSLLYASILSNAGLDPIIYLVPGHAYPGFRLNGQYYAIEATKIGGEGLGGRGSAQEALQTGMEELNKFIQQAMMGDPRYSIVDVHALNQQGVTPMNLKDDPFLRGKVDEIAASWSGGNRVVLQNPSAPQQQPPIRVQPVQENTPSPLPAPSTKNSEYSVPSNWQTFYNPVPQMPILTFQSVSPNGQITISAYDIPTHNLAEAMVVLDEYMKYLNLNFNYQINGRNLSGNTYDANGGNFVWKGKAQQNSRGIRFIAVGSNQQLYAGNQSIINKIYNSIP
ncbi:MAG: hypothetical protein Q4G27_10535 [Flavobacteriaceae bacterium]|nr:hypothetical protein [Flavobacteriaceae bacterium]